MRSVIIVLADGLRPDVITRTDMPSLDALARAYTMAPHATTVRPSRTVAALASLATGVAPATCVASCPSAGRVTLRSSKATRSPETFPRSTVRSVHPGSPVAGADPLASSQR